MAKFKIVESDRQIEKLINQSLAKEVNKSLSFLSRVIKSRIDPILTLALLTSPEMSSVRGGVLKAEFGLTFDPTNQIVKAIVDSINVEFTKVDEKFNGGVKIVMQPDDFANLLGLPVAEQPIEDGGSLPWLYWLLVVGDRIIISEYGVAFGNFQNSRTGLALMKRAEAPYKVNSAFSGTSDNNFITRSIGRVKSQIEREIEGVLKNGR